LSDLKCDLNCERCARFIEAINRVYITGIPFTDVYCPLELLDEARKAKLSFKRAKNRFNPSVTTQLTTTKVLQLKNIRNIY
jgi:hypothetical protein